LTDHYYITIILLKLRHYSLTLM